MKSVALDAHAPHMNIPTIQHSAVAGPGDSVTFVIDVCGGEINHMRVTPVARGSHRSQNAYVTQYAIMRHWPRATSLS